MESNITLYVFGLTRTYTPLKDQSVGIAANAEKQLLVNFGPPFVTFFANDILNYGKEWFLIDANGRNYGTEPYGVYIKSSDAKKILLDYFATRRQRGSSR